MYNVCGIYKITSPNKKVYIGQSKNVHQRFIRYKRGDCKGQKKLYNSINKTTDGMSGVAYGDAGVSQVCEVGTISGRSLRP